MAYRVVTKLKYKNVKIDYNGRRYDSKFEGSYAAFLDMLLKAGEIKEWKPQHRIELRVNGIKITTYIADFRVVTKDDTVQIHETKGMVLGEFKIKWALLDALKDEIEPGMELLLIQQKSFNPYKKATYKKK